MSSSKNHLIEKGCTLKSLVDPEGGVRGVRKYIHMKQSVISIDSIKVNACMVMMRGCQIFVQTAPVRRIKGLVERK